MPIFSKVFETIVCEQIQSSFKENNLFYDFQHACREGHSTGAALTEITELKCHTFTTKIMHWFESYLNSRKQCELCVMKVIRKWESCNVVCFKKVVLDH